MKRAFPAFRGQLKSGTYLISNMEDYEQIPFGKSGKNEYTVIIQVELSWLGKPRSEFWGYRIGKELIDRGFVGKMAFYSALSRTQLNDPQEPWQHFAKVIAHFQLPLKPESLSQLEIERFSDDRWKVFRDYYFKPTGVIDLLIHDILKLAPNRSHYANFCQEILKRILAYRMNLGAKTVRLAESNLPSLSDSSYHLEDQMQRILRSLKLDLNKVKQKNKNPEKKLKINLLIIEDDVELGPQLEFEFGKIFIKVKWVSKGSKALIELKKGIWDAVLIDMVLLDEQGFWQNIQGFELAKITRQSSRTVPFGLSSFSKMARNSIDELSMFKIFPKDLYNGIPIYESYASISKQIANQVKKLGRKRLKNGPQTGPWSKGLLQFYETQTKLGGFENFWEELYQKLDQFLSGSAPPYDLSLTSPKVLREGLGSRHLNFEYFGKVVFLRLYLLFKQNSEKDSQPSGYLDLRESMERLGYQWKTGGNLETVQRNFLYKLGLQYNSIKYRGKDFKKLKDLHLLSEESYWLKKNVEKPVKFTIRNIMFSFEEIPQMANKLPQEFRPKLKSFCDLPGFEGLLYDLVEFLSLTPSAFSVNAFREDLLYYINETREDYPVEWCQLKEYMEDPGRRLENPVKILEGFLS